MYKAATLIELIDQMLQLTGTTLFLSHEAHVEEVLGRIARNALTPPASFLPPSLAAYPDLGFHIDLRDTEEDAARLKILHADIAEHHKNAAVVTAAHQRLNAAYKKLPLDSQQDHYPGLPLPSKLAALRTAEHEAHQLGDDRFTFTIVAAVDPNGNPRSMQTYHLDASLSWPEMQNKMTEKTLFEAHDAGFPNGYTLADGKWVYKITKDSLPGKKWHALTTEIEYRHLRHLLATDSGAAVFVWHERVREEARKGQKIWEEMCRAEAQRSEDDWMRRNGWEVFEPLYDPDFSLDGEMIVNGPVENENEDYEAMMWSLDPGGHARPSSANSGLPLRGPG